MKAILCILLFSVGLAFGQGNPEKRNPEKKSPEKSSVERERESKREKRRELDRRNNPPTPTRTNRGTGQGEVIRTTGTRWIFDDEKENTYSEKRVESSTRTGTFFIEFLSNIRKAPFGLSLGGPLRLPSTFGSRLWFYLDFKLSLKSVDLIKEGITKNNDFTDIISRDQAVNEYKDDLLGEIDNGTGIFDIGLAYELNRQKNLLLMLGVGLTFKDIYYRYSDEFKDLTSDGIYYINELNREVNATIGLIYITRYNMNIHVGYDWAPRSLVLGLGYTFNR